MNGSNKTTKLLIVLVVVLASAMVFQGVYLFKLHRQFTQGPPPSPPGEPMAATTAPDVQDLKAPDNDPWDDFGATPFNPSTWDPFQEMNQMQEHMDRLFNDAFGKFGASSRFGDLVTGLSFNPKVDLSEDKSNYIVRVDVPGANESDINVSLEDQVLTVSGTRQQEVRGGNTKKLLTRERRIGSFERELRLPGPVNAADMTTAYKDGVLTITIPKGEGTSPSGPIDLR